MTKYRIRHIYYYRIQVRLNWIKKWIRLFRSPLTKRVIFHGGCLDCTTRLMKLDKFVCTGCQYFNANWDKEDLSNNRYKSKDEIKREERKKKLERMLYENY